MAMRSGAMDVLSYKFWRRYTAYDAACSIAGDEAACHLCCVRASSSALQAPAFTRHPALVRYCADDACTGIHCLRREDSR